MPISFKDATNRARPVFLMTEEQYETLCRVASRTDFSLREHVRRLIFSLTTGLYMTNGYPSSDYARATLSNAHGTTAFSWVRSAGGVADQWHKDDIAALREWLRPVESLEVSEVDLDDMECVPIPIRTKAV